MTHDAKLIDAMAAKAMAAYRPGWDFADARFPHMAEEREQWRIAMRAALDALDDSDLYWVAPQGATDRMQADFAECYDLTKDGPADAWGILRDAYLAEHRGDAG